MEHKNATNGAMYPKKIGKAQKTMQKPGASANGSDTPMTWTGKGKGRK